MTEQSETETKSKPKRSFNVVGILKTVAIVLAVIVFLMTAITNLLMVYIIFAPDDAPKPFYLMYYLPGQSPQVPVASETTPAASGNKTGESGSQSNTTKSGTSTASEGGSSQPVSNVMPGTGVLLDTGTKIVNLADPSGRTFIRTTIVLEFAPNSPEYFDDSVVQASGGGEGSSAATMTHKEAYTTSFKEELTTRLPVVNDIIITLLSTKKFDQIYTSEGKETLRQEIIQAINSRLHDYKVIQVYFTEFVVQ
jgi:flagellar basal body-associated protein FliL